MPSKSSELERSSSAKEPVRASAILVLGVLMGASAFTIDVSLPTLPALADALNVSDRAAQLAVTWALAGYALGQIPIGLVSDRLGRRRTASVSLLLFIAGAAGSAAAPTIELLWACRFVQGLGVAGGPLLARAIVRDLGSGDQAGRWLSSMATILGVISLSAPLLGGALLAWAGWRVPYLAIAVYGVLTLVAMQIYVPESSRSGRVWDSAWHQLRHSVGRFMGSRKAVFAALIYALEFAGFSAFLTNGSTIATRVYEVPAAWYGMLFAAVVGPQILGSLFSRRFSVHWGMVRVLFIGVSVIALASTLLFAVGLWPSPPLYAVWATLMIYGFGFGILMPAAANVALEPLPDVAGFASALVGALQVGIGTVTSAIAAANYQGTAQSMCWVMAASGLALVVVAVLGRDHLRA